MTGGGVSRPTRFDNISDVGEKSLTEKLLNSTFDRFWSDLEKKLKVIVAMKEEGTVPTRTDRELLQEILDIVRGLYGERKDSSTFHSYNELINKYNKSRVMQILANRLAMPPTERLKDKEYQKELKDNLISFLEEGRHQTEDDENNSQK